MRIPGVKTVKTLSRWVQARILGGALILGYHRVANVARDEYGVCVTPKHFAEQMEALSKYARPIRLPELVQHLKEGSVPRRSVAVTFDDGYADVLYEAKPVLERYEIPATVFVCTGYIGRAFWWDELEMLILSSLAELGALRLQIGEHKFVWDWPKVRPEAEGPEVRKQFCQALYQFLLPRNAEDQSHAMSIIRNWTGASSNGISVSRALSHTELLQLAEGRLIEPGSHTRHHLMLPRFSLEEQRADIILGKQDLEESLGRPVAGFAYPNGRASDDTKAIVREANFAFACTSLQNMVRPGADLHELTRFWQRDVDGDRFIQGLRLWMNS